MKSGRIVFAPFAEDSPSEFQMADGWPSIAALLERAGWTEAALCCLQAGPLRVKIEVLAADSNHHKSTASVGANHG